MAGSELPKPLRIAIGIRAHAHRKAAGIDQRQLAEKIGIAMSQISRVENGQSGCSMYFLLRLAWALDTEPADLLPDLDEVKVAFGKRGR